MTAADCIYRGKHWRVRASGTVRVRRFVELNGKILVSQFSNLTFEKNSKLMLK